VSIVVFLLYRARLLQLASRARMASMTAR
jgi:hypothetical protein